MTMKKHAVTEKQPAFGSLFNDISFGRKVRQLVEILNSETPSKEKTKFRPVSHPAGFSNLITKRWLTIAEAYVRLLSHTDDQNYVERIEALQTLMHHMRYSDKVSMPLNTARVQLALMKNAIKTKTNRRAQLEMMSDFLWASTGKGHAIRCLLRELDLIEIPETAQALSEQMLAWDDHVHISMSEGRRSPTLLVLDAFIKGLSRFTVSFYDFSDMEKIEEIYLACDILGIHGQVAIEFSVGNQGMRRSYLYIPPQIWHDYQLNNFVHNHKDVLHTFFEGLEENAKRRLKTIQELVEDINNHVILPFNAPFAELEALKLEPLSWKEVESLIQSSMVTRVHLGMLIFKAMRPVALKRVLYLENEYKTLNPDSAAAQTCKTRYEEALKFYDELTPTYCTTHYLVNEQVIDYDSAFQNEDDILPLLNQVGGYVVFIRPLQHGLKTAVDVFFQQYKNFTDIEIYNMTDAQQVGIENYTKFAILLHAIHEGEEAVSKFLKSEHLTDHSPEDITKLCQYIHEKNYYMRCASDSVGWSTQIPGMGFFQEYHLNSKSFRLFHKNGHDALPQPIADLICAHRPKDTPAKRVFQLSVMQPNGEWMDGDLTNTNQHSLRSLWRYMNPQIKNLFKVAVGFVPTYLCLGIHFALIWFILTAFRNALVDLISSGIGPKNWKAKTVDSGNLTTSLFFTGFSVPIMSAAKYAFDVIWTGPLSMEPDGFGFTLIKFCVIALANGCYLAFHNTLRGFTKPAIRGNFFRSVLSWPLATALSYVLTPLGVPDVVQAKLASEVVAGLIEGTVKFRRQSKMNKNVLLEVYRQVRSPVPIIALAAEMDILYCWSHYNMGRKLLNQLIQSPEKIPNLTDEQREDIKKTNQCLIHAFIQTGSLMTMTYAILEHYPEENITVLTQFVGETYNPFTDWLKHALPAQA